VERVVQEVSPVGPGDVVGGKYRVERVLGAGGMGVVVAAIQTELDRPVALKFLLPKLLERPGLVIRFSREARAAAKLESEHVARVLDVGTLEGGAPYIVMEYLEGHDLASVLAARGAFPSEQAVGYVLQACEAIAEAHSRGIVHRDLKPGNLFLTNRASGAPVIKVLDFGLSKIVSSGEEHVTSESGILGSPLYMSPEQLMSARTADARSDLWSMGVVLYELVTAHAPFEYERIAGLVAAILQKPPVPIAHWRADVPAELQTVVFRCLEKDPSQRFPTVFHLAKALAPFGPPDSSRSVERITHLLRSSSPKAAASEAAEGPPTETATAPNEAESVAGSSRSIRQPSVDATLPAAPFDASPLRRGRARAGLVGGVIAACIAAVTAFLAFSQPGRDVERGRVVPSVAIPVGRDGVTLPPPTPSLVDSTARAAAAAESAVATPRPASPAESTRKRTRPAPVGSVPAPPPSASAASARPAATPETTATPPDDPLRRLRPM
jgi:eukaryotic-like serine/threonine-protein kinase